MCLVLVGCFGAYGYGIQVAQRPATDTLERQLAPGVRYVRSLQDRGAPTLVHVLTVDLASPDVTLAHTAPTPTGGRDTRAETTSQALAGRGWAAAINAGFFEPYHARSPWDTYPLRGEAVDVNGLAISDGVAWNRGSQRLPVLCATDDQAIIQRGTCPEGTLEALGGSNLLVEQGRPRAECAASITREPRTAVGVSKDGRTAWLVVVDGRQPGYSAGLTLLGLAEVMAELGVWQALNLDGGGSSTMAAARGGGAEVLNAPIHTRIPMRERPVATHLGVRVSGDVSGPGR